MLDVNQRNFDTFKNLWYNEYLLSLRSTFRDIHDKYGGDHGENMVECSAA